MTGCFSSWALPPMAPRTVGQYGPNHFSADPVEELPRVIVTGSRSLAHPSPVRAALFAVWDELGRPFTVVHGACRTGADSFADWWAVEHDLAGIKVERHPADWTRHGRAAGPLRNTHLVSLGALRVLAFPLGASPGTRSCVRAAEAAGIPVVVHEGADA